MGLYGCSPVGYDPSLSALYPMTTAQAQAALAQAQSALVDLMTGAKGITFSYAQGDGSKTVAYQQTNQAQLRALISELQCYLGLRQFGRRPVRFNFR